MEILLQWRQNLVPFRSAKMPNEDYCPVKVNGTRMNLEAVTLRNLIARGQVKSRREN
jgi:hypothetical protein